MTEQQINTIQDPVQREIVYKHIMEKKTYRQIAAEMFYSRSTVRRKFHRAIQEFIDQGLSND